MILLNLSVEKDLNNPVNGTLNGTLNGTVNGGLSGGLIGGLIGGLNEIQRKIIKIILENNVDVDMISKKLNISLSVVEKNIMDLKEKL